jgi:NDP-sugar pyrophosphorylase family protein
MDAVLISAGLGIRMKPITDHIPKPLLPIVDFHLIDYNIDRLLKYGAESICINLFHKASSIREHLSECPVDLKLVTEKALTGTGGALRYFKDIVHGDFIYYSCDALTDIDLTGIIEFHRVRKPAATLVLLKHGNARIITIDVHNKIIDIADHDRTDGYDFAGIAIFSDRIFSYLLNEDKFSIVDVWKRMLGEHEMLLGIPSSANWYNINSPATYWQVHHDLLANGMKLGGRNYDSSVYIDPSSQVHTKKIKGFVSIGPNCKIFDQVAMTNTVVLSNSVVKRGDYKDCLLSDRYHIEINQ